MRTKILTDADVFNESIPTFAFAVATGAVGTSVLVNGTRVSNTYNVTFTIPRGDRGLTGITPALTIGNIVTGAAGGTASAALRGTAENPILDLTLIRGNTGLTPNLTIGTVSTGAAGSAAVASFRGTADAPILDLTFPRGNTGNTPSLSIGNITTGAAGSSASAALRGTTDAPILDLNLPRGNTGVTPAFTIGNVTTGAAGASAAASLRGTAETPILDLSIPRGITGATPNLTIGNVVTGNAGTSASASFRGTAENPILDLTIPRGAAGAGTGDVLAANNGSEYTPNKGTFLANVGAGTGTGGGRDVFYAADASAVRTAIGAVAASAIGTAAMYNVGVTNGNIAVLESGGVFNAARIPVVMGHALDVLSPDNSGTTGGLRVRATSSGSAIANQANIQFLSNDGSAQYGVLYSQNGTLSFDGQFYLPSVTSALTSAFRTGTSTSVMSIASFWNAQAVVAVGDGTNPGLNFDAGINFSLALTTAVGATRTFNSFGGTAKIGQRGFIRFVQPSGGGISVTFSTGLFRPMDGITMPVVNTASNAITIVEYVITGSTEVSLSAGRQVATVTDILANTAGSLFFTPNAYWAAQVPQALTDAASTTIDFNTGLNFTLLTTTGIGATRTLALSNATKVGQRGFIRITQGAGLAVGTVHNVLFGAGFRYGDNSTAPLVNPGAGAITVFSYEITTAGEVSITGGRTFASTSEFLTGTSTAALNPATFWNAQLPATIADPGPGAGALLNMNSAVNFTLAIGTGGSGTRSLATSGTLKVGQTGWIRVVQAASPANVATIGFDSNFRADDNATLPTLNVALNSVTILRYQITGTNEVTIFGGKPVTANPEATAAEYRSATVGRVLAPDKVWAANQVVTLSTTDITSGLNFNNFINATYSLSQPTLEIANPSGGMKPGQSGVITIVNNLGPVGSPTAVVTLNFGDQWFAANGTVPALSTMGGSITRLFYTITTAGTVDMFFSSNMGRTYDADAAAYFAAMTNQPTAARKVLINDFIKGLKADGVWAKLDNVWLLASHDEQSSRINAVRPSKLLSKYNSPYFVADRGWQQTSSDGGVSSNQLYSPDAYFGASLKRNNVHDLSFGVWQNTAFNETQNGYLCGETSSNFYDYMYYNGTLYGKIAASQMASLSYTQQKGLRAVTHINGDANQYVFASGVGFGSIAYNGGSNTSTTFSLLNTGGLGSYNGTNNRQAFGFTGAGLTQTQINALNSRVNTYLTAIGAN